MPNSISFNPSILYQDFAYTFSDAVLLSSRWLTNEETFRTDADWHLQMQATVLEKSLKIISAFYFASPNVQHAEDFFLSQV